MQWQKKYANWTRQIISAGLLLSMLAGAAFTLTTAFEAQAKTTPFAVACWAATPLWAIARRQTRKTT